MQPFLLEKPVAHSTVSKFSAVLIGRIVSRYIFNSVGTAAAKSHAEIQIRNPHTSDTNGSVTSCSSSLKAERTWLPLVHRRYQVHFESWWVQRRPRRSAVSCNMVCCGSPCTLQAYTRSTDGKVRSRYGEVAFNGPVSWH